MKESLLVIVLLVCFHDIDNKGFELYYIYLQEEEQEVGGVINIPVMQEQAFAKHEQQRLMALLGAMIPEQKKVCTG